jgi:hypothetical protein
MVENWYFILHFDSPAMRYDRFDLLPGSSLEHVPVYPLQIYLQRTRLTCLMWTNLVPAFTR